jgi:hypothetical protein
MKSKNILWDTKEYANGFSIIVDVPQDDSLGEPWSEHDGHGIVSKWRYIDSKKAGERILCSDGSHTRFYHMQETMQKAREENWGCGEDSHTHKTKGERVACAVEQDFQHMQDWCENRWTWVGITVILTYTDNDGEVEEVANDSLWGMESDDTDYLNSEARNMAAMLLSERHKYVADLAASYRRKADALERV